MNLKFTGKYKSLTPFELNNLSELTIITGLNGSGKSQLLQLISSSYNNYNQKDYLEINDVDVEKKGALYWRPTGLNIQLGNQSFGYNDLEFFVKYILAKISNNSALLNELIEDDPNDHNSYQYVKNQMKHSINYKAEKIISEIERRTGLLRKDLSPLDISYHFPEEILLEDYDLFNQDSLEMIFFMYLYKKIANEKYRLNLDIPEKAPWIVLNEILQSLNLKYKLTQPDEKLVESIFQNALNSVTTTRFKISLLSTINNLDIGFQNISSGEKVLLSLGLLIYYSQNRNAQKKLLILDEPEAHLHPSLTKQFFEVIYEFFIKKYNGRVIMTTHSPSTIAIAPEDKYCKIYCIEKNPTNIYEIKNKDEAISILSSGLLLVSSNTKYIFTEGKNDKPFYKLIYKNLLQDNFIINYPSLIFIPCKGKDSVEHMVNELRNSGQKNYFGIIDLDKNNQEKDFIKVINRYSIENYLLDPIILYSTTNIKLENLKEYNIQKGNEHNIRSLSNIDLQKISDEVINNIKSLIPDITPIEEILCEIKYVDGRKINVPSWFLKRKGKNLLTFFQKKYGGASAINYLSLQTNISRSNLIPYELKLILEKIIKE